MLRACFILFCAFCIYWAEGSLGGYCEVDGNCEPIDSHCSSDKTCACLNHFIPLDGACAQIISGGGDPCLSNYDCQKYLRSQCVNSVCVCHPYHHFSNGVCINNRGLYENCDFHEQCYWGQDMLKKMSCNGGKCSCNSGYHQNGRKCSGAESCTSNAAFLCVLFSTLMLLCTNYL